MRQKKILFILLALLGLAVAYAVWNSPRQERVTAGASTTRAGRAAAKAKEEAVAVRLDLLQREREKFSGVQRDLFTLLQPAAVRPAAPPPPPPPVLPPPPVEPPPVSPEELAATQTARELARFTFLGFLQKGGVKTIFLSAAEEIFLVRKGDRFGGGQQFLVTELTSDRLVIRQGEGTSPIVISLVEQAPLAMNRSPAPGLPASGRFRSGPPAAGMSPLRGGVPPTAEGRYPTEESPAPAPEAPSPPAPDETDEGLLKPLPRSDFNNLFSSPR